MATISGFMSVNLSVLTDSEVAQLIDAVSEEMTKKTGTVLWAVLDNPVSRSMAHFVYKASSYLWGSDRDARLGYDRDTSEEEVYTGCELGCCDSCSTKECMSYTPSPDWDGDY
jgi:hypothetical protein